MNSMNAMDTMNATQRAAQRGGPRPGRAPLSEDPRYDPAYDEAELVSHLSTLGAAEAEIRDLNLLVEAREETLQALRKAMWHEDPGRDRVGTGAAIGSRSEDAVVTPLAEQLLLQTRAVEERFSQVRAIAPWIRVVRHKGLDYMEKMVDDARDLRRLREYLFSNAIAADDPTRRMTRNFFVA
jgi:hypothetical protein